ncbi:hypothetical protein KIPB_012200, partial [Kipferlia bialata]|eukprot:g12200.t1
MAKDAQQTYTRKAIMGICGMLTFGTGTMISSKIMLDTRACPLPSSVGQEYAKGDCASVGIDKIPFQKPWFQTGAMFSAMTMCLFGWMFERSQARKSDLAGYEAMAELEGNAAEGVTNATPLKGDAEEKGWLETLAQRRPALANLFIGVPSVFDMIATTLMTMGLIYIDVSIMQMLRGSMVIFSAVFCVFFLKRKIRPWMWTAVGLTATACTLVGFSCIQAAKNDVTGASMAEQLYGCFLVVCSQ